MSLGQVERDTSRTQDGVTLERIFAKMARKERLSAGEREALRVALDPLVRSVATKTVWRRGMSYGAHRAAVEDVVQEAWLIAWEIILPKFNPTRGTVYSLVRTVLRRRLIDWLEKQSNTRSVSLTHPEAVADTSAADDETPPVSEAEKTAARKVLRDASDDDRLIYQKRQKGWTHAEIASELGISEKATRTRFHRLCERIRATSEERLN